MKVSVSYKDCHKNEEQILLIALASQTFCKSNSLFWFHFWQEIDSLDTSPHYLPRFLPISKIYKIVRDLRRRIVPSPTVDDLIKSHAREDMEIIPDNWPKTHTLMQDKWKIL